MANKTIYIDPSHENFQTFKALPRDEPIHMLNLLRFRSEAMYPPDHPHATKQWSGERAYKEYGRKSGPIFRHLGGSIIWRGSFQTMVTGPENTYWDEAFIAQYPDSNSFFAMIKDPSYQLAVVNRTAALSDSRLVRFQPKETGQFFS